MATNFRESRCPECGKVFVHMRVYQGGWPWKLYDGSRKLLFCCYACRESFRKRMKPLRKDLREQERITLELAGVIKQRE